MQVFNQCELYWFFTKARKPSFPSYNLGKIKTRNVYYLFFNQYDEIGKFHKRKFSKRQKNSLNCYLISVLIYTSKSQMRCRFEALDM